MALASTHHDDPFAAGPSSRSPAAASEQRSASAALRPALEWRVQSGPQAGARSPLPSADAGSWELHVGPTPAPAPAGAGNDLVLRGRVQARLRVSPGSDGRGLRLQLLDGQAQLGSRTLLTWADVPWPMYEVLKVGETSIAYGSALQPQWGDGDAAPVAPGSRGDVQGQGFGNAHDAADNAASSSGAASIADAGNDGPAAARALASGLADAAVPAAQAGRGWQSRLVITGLALVLGSGLLFGLIKALGFGQPPSQLIVVQQAVAAEGLNLAVRAEGNQVVIEGKLASGKQLAALEALNTNRKWGAKIDVQVPPLTEQVAQHFAVQFGIPAPRVENRGDGKVDVYTRTDKLATDPAVERAVADAIRAIPGVAAVVVHNELPAAVSSCSKKGQDAGDRPTSVVWDPKRPVLNTATGQSYTVGSMLPSGLRIVSFDKSQGVLVRCGDEKPFLLIF